MCGVVARYSLLTGMRVAQRARTRSAYRLESRAPAVAVRAAHQGRSRPRMMSFTPFAPRDSTLAVVFRLRAEAEVLRAAAPTPAPPRLFRFSLIAFALHVMMLMLFRAARDGYSRMISPPEPFRRREPSRAYRRGARRAARRAPPRAPAAARCMAERGG